MDPIRFDALVRVLSHLRSRRAALGLLAAGGLLAPRAADAAAADKARPVLHKKKCKHGRRRCGTGCVDLQTDPANCGMCDRTCASAQVCQDRVCVGGGCAPDCTGKACGDDGCGGSCGACQPHELCQNGACECGASRLGQECADAATCCPGDDCAAVDAFKGQFPIPVCVAGDATVCCAVVTANCVNDCDCCGVLRCSAATGACCLPSGEPNCQTDSDCCSGSCRQDVVSACA